MGYPEMRTRPGMQECAASKLDAILWAGENDNDGRKPGGPEGRKGAA
jgi:hypothetical protein